MARTWGGIGAAPEVVGLSHGALDDPQDLDGDVAGEGSRLVPSRLSRGEPAESCSDPEESPRGELPADVVVPSCSPEGLFAYVLVTVGVCAGVWALWYWKRRRGLDAASRPSLFVLWDTEQTSWKGSNERRWRGFIPGTSEREHREIIQISALQVRLNPELSPPISLGDSLRVFVRPRVHPFLSDYVISLTNISQIDIDGEGVPLIAALDRLHAIANPRGVGAGRGRGPKCGSTLLSWGNDWNVVEENLRLYNASLHGSQSGWRECMHDVRPLFEVGGLNLTGYTSGSIHRALNLSTAGHVHDSLWDCMSLFLTLRELLSTRGSKGSAVMALLKRFVRV